MTCTMCIVKEDELYKLLLSYAVFDNSTSALTVLFRLEFEGW